MVDPEDVVTSSVLTSSSLSGLGSRVAATSKPEEASENNFYSFVSEPPPAFTPPTFTLLLSWPWTLLELPVYLLPSSIVFAPLFSDVCPSLCGAGGALWGCYCVPVDHASLQVWRRHVLRDSSTLKDSNGVE